MNTDDLRRSYADFVDLAHRAPFAALVDGELNAAMVLAHVIVGDKLIAQTAADVIAGNRPQFDNGAALSETYLRAVIDATGDWSGLIEAVHQGGGAAEVRLPLHSEQLASPGIPRTPACVGRT